MHSIPFLFDLASLRGDLTPLFAESRLVARDLRAPWTRPVAWYANAQRTRARLARRITELLVVLAFTRGKLHVRARPRGLPDGAAWDPRAFALAEATRVAGPYALTKAATNASGVAVEAS